MVNNQIEFNEKYSQKEEIEKIEIKRNRNFQGEIIIEDYSGLEELNLRDIKNIDKITLKNLPQLQECTIWNCGTKELVIENCSQIKRLNVRSNSLVDLGFLASLDNLEELEIDGNAQLTGILKSYNDDWKDYRKRIQLLISLVKKRPHKLLNLQEELMSSQRKYSDLKRFLKEVLTSLSWGAQEEIVSKLNTEIKGEEEKNYEEECTATNKLKTEILMFDVEEIIKSTKELKEELEVKLATSEVKIKKLKTELVEAKSRYEEREKEIEELRSLISIENQKQSSEAIVKIPTHERTLDFLRAKSIFLNARQETIGELKKCLITLENRFGKSEVVGEMGNTVSNIGGSLSNIAIFGFSKAIGEAIVAGNNFSKIKLSRRSNEEFQILLKNEEELSDLENTYGLLIELVHRNDGLENPEINILNLKDRQVYGKKHLFNEECEIFDILEGEGIWKKRTLTPEKMEAAIISLSKNLKELESEWEEQFEKIKRKLSKEHANLFAQEQQVRIEIQQTQCQLEELISLAKDKLKSKKWSAEEREKRDREREILLNNLLEAQKEIINSDDTFDRQEKLVSLQSELSEVAIRHGHKEFKKELENLCQAQTELTQLQIELESLQEKQQSQIQIPPK